MRKKHKRVERYYEIYIHYAGAVEMLLHIINKR